MPRMKAGRRHVTVIEKFYRPILLIGLALALAACSTNGETARFVSGGTSTKPKAEPIRNYNANEMRAAIVGKTFQYTRADGNGFITYVADGTFSYEDDVKGPGKGKWTADGTRFCETYGSNPTACGDFTSTGDAYFAAQSRLVEMKN
jgi:hypothetical protein